MNKHMVSDGFMTLIKVKIMKKINL